MIASLNFELFYKIQCEPDYAESALLRRENCAVVHYAVNKTKKHILLHRTLKEIKSEIMCQNEKTIDGFFIDM